MPQPSLSFARDFLSFCRGILPFPLSLRLPRLPFLSGYNLGSVSFLQAHAQTRPFSPLPSPPSSLLPPRPAVPSSQFAEQSQNSDDRTAEAGPAAVAEVVAGATVCLPLDIGLGGLGLACRQIAAGTFTTKQRPPPSTVFALLRPPEPVQLCLRLTVLASLSATTSSACSTAIRLLLPGVPPTNTGDFSNSLQTVCMASGSAPPLFSSSSASGGSRALAPPFPSSEQALGDSGRLGMGEGAADVPPELPNLRGLDLTANAGAEGGGTPSEERRREVGDWGRVEVGETALEVWAEPVLPPLVLRGLWLLRRAAGGE